MEKETNLTEKSLSITATPIEGENYVHLEWTNLGAGYKYMVYSKGQNEAVYQSIPSKTNIRVLNIYPGKGNNLKGWMENPNSESANGYGKALIAVDEVNIDAFNANPMSYMKDANGSWKYDVIYEGAWDVNNSKDLSIQGLTTIKEFIDSGRGYLCGHDTIFTRNDFTATNRNKLVSYINLKTATYSDSYNMGSSSIKILKKGLLTNYPWSIGDIGTTLNVPMSHTSSQFASGDVWMSYSNNQWSSAKEISSYEGQEVTNNFYLTTWNNTAMIQTGHSNGAATPDEQKLLANTLFYLAQLTSDTSCDDHKGQDLTAPDKVTITSASNDDKNLNISYSKANDNGTKYEYYVKASDGNTANDITSDTVSTINTAGIAGYSYVIDNIENTEPNSSIDTKDLSISVPLSQIDLLKPIYIHIKAIDNAGNLSETTHYKYEYIASLELDKTAITLKEGEAEQLIAITDPPAMEVTWSSSDTSVATVDAKGKVTAIKKGQATITATTTNGSNLSATCIVMVKKKIILDVEPEKNKIHLKENAVVHLTIDNIKEIAAEDAIIKYDSTKLKFIGMTEVKGIKLVKLEQDEDELRIITASRGLSRIVNDKKILLKLYFKGIASGEALVDVIKGKVTDGIEMEKDLIDDECGQTTIIIDDVVVDDVNHTGEFTLLDLGIDGRHLGEDPKTLPQYNTDQVINGAIDDDDLLKIGEYMLANPNYRFN